MRVVALVIAACGGSPSPPPGVAPPQPQPDAAIVTTGISGRLLIDGAPITYFGITATVGFTYTGLGAIPVHTHDGRFRVPIPAATLDLMFVGPGFARRVVPDVEIADGQVTELGDIAVERGHTLTGTVRDDDGRPLAGARVHVRQSAAQPRDELDAFASGIVATTADVDGRYRIQGLGDLPLERPHDTTVRATASDGHASLPLEVPDADATIDLVAHPSGTIEVRARPIERLPSTRSGRTPCSPPTQAIGSSSCPKGTTTSPCPRRAVRYWCNGG